MVLVVEKAPESQRGGNSFFTAGGFRFAHQGLEDLRRDILPDLSEEEARRHRRRPPTPRTSFYDDLMRVTEGLSRPRHGGVPRPALAAHRRVDARPRACAGSSCSAASPTRSSGKHHFWGGLNVEAVGGGAGLIEMLLRARGQDGHRGALRAKAPAGS